MIENQSLWELKLLDKEQIEHFELMIRTLRHTIENMTEANEKQFRLLSDLVLILHESILKAEMND